MKSTIHSLMIISKINLTEPQARHPYPHKHPLIALK
nr:MAG TPA: hypothetical protein [Caudoviricetes sp.]